MAGMKVVFKKGDILFKEGDSSKDLIIVEEGIVKIYKTTVKSEVIPIALAKKGQFIGELSFFDGQPRSATAQAVTDLTVIKITPQMLQTELKKYPKWVFTLVNTMGKRLRDIDDILKRNKIVDNEMISEFNALDD